MAQRFLNNQDYANDFRQKINDNFTELFGNNVPTNHTSATDMYGLGTTQLYGHLRVQQANGLSVNSGTVTMSQSSPGSYGVVKLANSAASTSPTDVVTSKILNDALRGQTTIPKIYYGTTDPTQTSPANAVEGDIYVKYL